MVDAVDRVTREVVLTTGIAPAKVAELQERMEQGDEAAFDQMLQELEKVAIAMESLSPAEKEQVLFERSMQIMWQTFPMMLSSALLSILMFFVASTYFYVVFVRPKESISSIVTISLQKVVPMLGLFLWVIIRSYAWVPFLGAIFAFLWLPRYTYAPLYVLRDAKSIRESAKQSFSVTEKQWGRIVGTLIVAMVLTSLALWFLSFVVTSFGAFAFTLAFVVSQVQGAFLSAVIVQLEAT